MPKLVGTRCILDDTGLTFEHCSRLRQVSLDAVLPRHCHVPAILNNA